MARGAATGEEHTAKFLQLAALGVARRVEHRAGTIAVDQVGRKRAGLLAANKDVAIEATSALVFSLATEFVVFVVVVVVVIVLAIALTISRNFLSNLKIVYSVFIIFKIANRIDN